MIGIVIVAHGGLASESLQTVEHIIGKQPGVKAIEFGPDYQRDTKEREICEAADAVDQGKGVVVVADIFGATPSNLALFACKPEKRRIIYGANMPALVKLAKCRDMPLDDAVRAALAAGKKHIGSLNMTTDD